MQDNGMTYKINQANVAQAQPDYENFRAECRDPFAVNERLLLGILRDNRDTEYGRRYDFEHITSYEEYKEKVPVITYNDIAGDIDRMLNGERNILTAYPFTHMNETSGTVGKPKLIPMTDKQTQVFLKYNKHYMDAFFAENFGDEWMKGHIFCTAQGKYRTAPSGITIGDASSKMAEYVQGGRDGVDAMLRAVYTSPVEATIPDLGTDTKYIHTRFALADGGVTGIISGFYIMVVQYLHYIAENYRMLIHDIETGTIDERVDLPAEVRASLLRKISPMPERAAELREIFKNGSDFPFVKAVWPNMRFIFGVGGDGFSVYANTIRRMYADESVKFVLSGVTSSEGLWSVPVEPESEDAVLVPGSAFMEFLPVDANDDFSKCVSIDKLETGRIYELIITNLCGFYRYRMSDALLVTGFCEKTPRVRFMYRVDKNINLACEKTTEKALQQAVEKTAEALGFELSDYTVYPDAASTPPGYTFLIQPPFPVDGISEELLAETVDRFTCEANPVYEECIRDHSMRRAKACWLQPETTFLWRELQIAKGKSAGQLKPVRTVSNEDQRKFFFIMRENR
ncbi:MAG: GH3 auxin-responsive promoter family protein [Clostridia bacterium]|nr:GH3 auxin-responsive promoter family protein [Clostridia bacterium]